MGELAKGRSQMADICFGYHHSDDRRSGGVNLAMDESREVGLTRPASNKSLNRSGVSELRIRKTRMLT